MQRQNNLKTKHITNYRVLYRSGVELTYLVILYKDVLGKPRTPPSSFFGFRLENGSAIMKKNHTPQLIKNVHGSKVYQRYVERGWADITKTENLVPWSIKSWLSHQLNN